MVKFKKKYFLGFNNEYDGRYVFGSKYSDGKQVFEKEDKCIWWHRQYRHWWIGPCENVGTNSGFAYIQPDLRCPMLSSGLAWIEIDWRRGGSNEPIKRVEQNYGPCFETFDEDGNWTGAVII